MGTAGMFYIGKLCLNHKNLFCDILKFVKSYFLHIYFITKSPWDSIRKRVSKSIYVGGENLYFCKLKHELIILYVNIILINPPFKKERQARFTTITFKSLSKRVRCFCCINPTIHNFSLNTLNKKCWSYKGTVVNLQMNVTWQ